MSPNKYSAQELLGLRDRAVPVKIPDVPLKGASPAPQQAARPLSSESRTLGRFNKLRPYHDQESGTVRTRPEFSVLPAAADDHEFVQHRPRHDTENTMHGEPEWRFRARAGSEAASATEPLAAPTGLNAQQSEGFQRFYKAVISPTHVRVTAGGRIVPNTRGTSPTSKRLKDRPDDGGQPKNGIQNGDEQNHQLPDHAYPPGAKAQPMPLFAYPPHPFHPPFPATLARMPMMHMGMGMGMPPGFAYTHQPPLHSSFPPMHLDPARSFSKENQQNGQRHEAPGSKVLPPESLDGKTRRASSSQFEHPKPFVFGGQPIYPFPPPGFPSHLPIGNQAQFPPGFIGHPFPGAAFPNPMMGPPPLGMNHMLNQGMAFPGMLPPMQLAQSGPNQAPLPEQTNAADPPALSAAPQDLSAPPISSIRPSEISRKQINMLRASLKYHEDQLQYNKHQIDEKEMEHTVQMLRAQIERFEILNQGQLRFEEEHYPKKETKPTKPSGSHSRTLERASRNTGSGQSTGKNAPSTIKRLEGSRQKSLLRKKEPFFSLNPVESPVSIVDPIKKSTLPSGAALAPPFKPRTVPCLDGEVMQNTGSTFQWDGPVVDVRGTHNTTNGETSASGTLNNNNNSLSLANSPHPQRPYLVGTLRPGVDPQHARETDYVYERELTPDENRSRYLYWGKAPSFTRKGLPKFDGKDFYPPSPQPAGAMVLYEAPPTGQSDHSGEPSAAFSSTASQPDSTALPRGPAAGSGAPSFSRERQKPVKVTIRRPDSDVVIKPQRINIKPPKPDEAQASNGSGGENRRDKVEPSSPGDFKKTRFLHNVLRRNMSCNNEVLPGALTSANVQGVLPQYSTGYDSLMAASLSPLSSSQLTLGHPSSRSDEDGSVFLTPASRKMGENRPPLDNTEPASLEQRFKEVTALESKHSAALPAQWTGL